MLVSPTTFMPNQSSPIPVTAARNAAITRPRPRFLSGCRSATWAIPVHLLTLEAIELNFQKLTVDGYLLVHTSNRFVDLNPVLREAGRQLIIEVPFQDHDANTEATSGGAFESSWVMLHRVRPDGRAPQSIANDRWWARDEIERIRPSTDDYADVFSRLVWKHILR
tara:strand:- start:460 stop:957 length:498 start_codon:yes stop_codon:yes gene_type:complete